MELKRVVVTGIGAITPLGNNIPDYFSGLRNGVSGAGPIPYFDVSKFKTRFGCCIKNFDPLNYWDKKEARKLDPFTQYALISSDEAILDSGLDMNAIDKTMAGVIWASGIGGIDTLFKEVQEYFKGLENPRFSPFLVPKMISDIAAGHISMKHGLHGPNFCVTSACASSTNGLIDAYLYISNGIADVIVSGGSEFPMTHPSLGGFSSMKALSERNDDFLTASRPYDKDRDGFVMGEGGGALILEEYEYAKKRGAKIYAELVGIGATADAYHITAPHPEGLGAALAMNNALKFAGIKTSDIDYVNTHGTSTPLGDIAEIKAITKVFGDDVYRMNISSTKSMTGHMLGAAGAIEALACIFALQEQTIPPTINHFTDDPEIDSKLDLTFNTAKKRDVKYALSNTFGFGGHNATVIFKKPD